VPALLKLSPAMISYYRGKPWAHLAGRSMHGGSGQTWCALYRLGLLSADDELTERGQYEATARVSYKGALSAYFTRRIMEMRHRLLSNVDRRSSTQWLAAWPTAFEDGRAPGADEVRSE